MFIYVTLNRQHFSLILLFDPQTYYIKLYIIILKYIYKSKTRMKLHENIKIKKKINLYNKNIIVESKIKCYLIYLNNNQTVEILYIQNFSSN